MATQTLQNPNAKPRPALRLVGTKQLPREDWLAVRKQGIGSSDAAAAVGLNPYKSQLELWLEKTGRDSSLPKLDHNDEESPAYWGNILEPIVATHYTKRSATRASFHRQGRREKRQTSAGERRSIHHYLTGTKPRRLAAAPAQ